MFKPIDTTVQMSSERRVDISWLRILAVLLLFPFHTARIFDVWDQFYVKNDQLSTALTYFIAFMEPWHMPLLFLLAGAASWFALSRRSGGRYAGERVKRLLVPFVFGLLVLIPPQSYFGLLSHSGSAPAYFQWLPEFFHLNAADLDGYFLGGHTWGHLWFIVHLLLYSLLALPLMLFLRRGAGRRVVAAIARAATVPGVILLFALALVPAMFVPEIAGGNPVFYVVLFVLGYLMMGDERFAKAIDAHRLPAFVLGPIACLLVAYFEVTSWPALPVWAEGPLELYLAVFLPWCFLVALMAYGRRFLRSSSRFLAYADEASYPVYLLHQTVIVIVGFVVVQWGVGAPVKFVAALFVSLLVTLLVYELAVRRVGATRFLFGMRPLRRKAPAVEAPAESPALGLRERTFATAARPAVVRLPASPERAS
jgi:glucan biosynthesis protein C